MKKNLFLLVTVLVLAACVPAPEVPLEAIHHFSRIHSDRTTRMCRNLLDYGAHVNRQCSRGPAVYLVLRSHSRRTLSSIAMVSLGAYRMATWAHYRRPTAIMYFTVAEASKIIVREMRRKLTMRKAYLPFLVRSIMSRTGNGCTWSSGLAMAQQAGFLTAITPAAGRWCDLPRMAGAAG